MRSKGEWRGQNLLLSHRQAPLTFLSCVVFLILHLLEVFWNREATYSLLAWDVHLQQPKPPRAPPGLDTKDLWAPEKAGSKLMHLIPRKGLTAL